MDVKNVKQDIIQMLKVKVVKNVQKEVYQQVKDQQNAQNVQ